MDAGDTCVDIVFRMAIADFRVITRNGKVISRGNTADGLLCDLEPSYCLQQAVMLFQSYCWFDLAVGVVPGAGESEVERARR